MRPVQLTATSLVGLIGTKSGFMELAAFAPGKAGIKATKYINLASESAPDEVVGFLEQYANDHDLYYGVHPRERVPQEKFPGQVVRSRAEDVNMVVGMFVDIDAKDYDDDMNRVEELLAKVSFTPHLKLMSGHGVQVRWNFPEPIYRSDTENFTRCQILQRRLNAFVGGDKVHNLDRLARVPDSVNRKYPDQPVQTKAIWNLDAPAVSLDEWDALLPQIAPEASKNDYGIQFPAVAPEVPWKKIPKRFVERPLMDDRSEQDFMACIRMLEFGLTIDEIYAVYQESNNLTQRYHEEVAKGRGDDYLRRTLNAALNKLGGHVPALILPRLRGIDAKSLNNEGTVVWISESLHCHQKQWPALLWEVRTRSSLGDKAFKELVENAVYDLFRSKSINELAPILGLTYGADLPWGYVIFQDRTHRLKPEVELTEGAVRVSVGPLVLGFTAAIANRQRDEEGRHFFEVVHDERGQRESIVIPASMVTRASDISKLADLGMDVSSNDAKDVVEYFNSYLQTNKGVIPELQRVTQCGWHGNGFAYGSDIINMPSAIIPEPDGGEKLTMDALDMREGSLERQLEMVRGAIDYPRVALGIYAAFAAPLLHLWNEQGFIVDYAGVSSVGKSTTLQVIGSLWGRADKRGSAINVIRPWKGTYVGHERYLAFMQNLPAFMDETKTMIRDDRNREIVVDVAYSAANGMGKTRGKIQGSQKPSTWRTIVFSTGEQPLSGLSKDAGLQARTIQMWGPPFQDAGKDVVDWFDVASFNNTGWMGRKFVEYVVQNAASVTAMTSVVKEMKARRFLTTDPIGARHADYFAVIATAGLLVHQVFPELGVFDVGALEALFQSTIGSNPAKTQGYAALEVLESMVASELERFQRNSAQFKVYGRIQNLPKDRLRYVAIIQGVFEEAMRNAGLDAEGVLREWEQKGWLDVSPDSAGRRTRKHKCGDHKMLRLFIQDLPAEFQDSFRDPDYWRNASEDPNLEQGQETERDREQQNVVQFPAGR